MLYSAAYHFFFFFKDPATTEIYPLPLHDALPISRRRARLRASGVRAPGDALGHPRRTVVIEAVAPAVDGGRYPVKREVGAVLEVTADVFKEGHEDRKSTRLNSSHDQISYAVFCLK